MRKIWIGLIVLLALAGGMMLMAKRTEPEWSTDSPAALAAFERGLDAQMKYYGSDAHDSYREALEHDPDFAAAKLMLLHYERDKEREAQLAEELRQVDRKRLTRRERFLVDYALARHDGDSEKADRIVNDYLERRPKDPYALAACSTQAWEDSDWSRAERHYRHLLEVDPNWVSAQNHLGYLAMAQGRFKEAEELLFETYNFIAPDQANPHDSMGELLMTLGRYEEARQALERALEIKPDFCASYEHLFSVATLEGSPDDYPQILARARQHCGERMAEVMGCLGDLWRDYLERDYEAAWSEDRKECSKLYVREPFLLHRLAVLTGRTEAALELEALVRKRAAKGGREGEMAEPLLRHMTGVRHLGAGDWEAAVSELTQADAMLFYWGQGYSILKMYNQMNLAVALQASGQTIEAERILAKVREVNPRFADVYPEIRAEFGRA